MTEETGRRKLGSLVLINGRDPKITEYNRETKLEVVSKYEEGRQESQRTGSIITWEQNILKKKI